MLIINTLIQIKLAGERILATKFFLHKALTIQLFLLSLLKRDIKSHQN